MPHCFIVLMRVLAGLLITLGLTACGALGLAACGDPAPVSGGSDSDVDVELGAEPDTPLGAPQQAARPAGSAGSFTLRYIRGSVADADTIQIDGFLPPPVPAEALGSLPLDAVPAFTAAVKPSSVSDAVDLREAGGYVLATVNEVGALKASVRTATSPLPIRSEGLFRGDVYAFSFEPLWTSVASAPQLWVRDADKEDIVHGTLPLPITRAPVWAHPIRLPTSSPGPVIRFAFDLEVTQNRLLPLLVYPSRFSQPWSAAPFRADALKQRLRDLRDESNAGTPYTVSVSSLDTTQPVAYLVLLRL